MTINFEQVDNVIRNIIFTINALSMTNNQLESEASRLSKCNGTKENPHNHSAQIASIRKILYNNKEKIEQLKSICEDLKAFKDSVFASDKKLSQLFDKNDLAAETGIESLETLLFNSPGKYAAYKAGLLNSYGQIVIDSVNDYELFDKVISEEEFLAEYYYTCFPTKTKLGTENKEFVCLDVILDAKQGEFYNTIEGAANFSSGKKNQGEVKAPDEQTQLYLYGISQKTGMDYPLLLGIWSAESTAAIELDKNGGTMGLTNSDIFTVINEETKDGYTYSNTYKEDIERIITETYIEVYGVFPPDYIKNHKSIYYDSVVCSVELTDSLYSWKTGGSNNNCTAWDGYISYCNNFTRASKYANDIRRNLTWIKKNEIYDYETKMKNSGKMQSTGGIK